MLSHSGSKALSEHVHVMCALFALMLSRLLSAVCRHASDPVKLAFLHQVELSSRRRVLSWQLLQLAALECRWYTGFYEFQFSPAAIISTPSFLYPIAIHAGFDIK